MRRREFLGSAFCVSALTPHGIAEAAEPDLRISLAEWSLHRAIQSRLITNLDFPRIAREQFGIEGLEFVNQLWEAPTQSYVQRLKSNIQKTGTRAVLIMCDGEGFMGHSGKAERMRAARNHYKWVDISAELGGHAIRVNMDSDLKGSTPAEVQSIIGYSAESFADLCQYAARQNINVLIENHVGVSLYPDPIVQVIKQVGLPNFGTLPDSGNWPKGLDRYEAVGKLMPFAKGVSCKFWDFAPSGEESTIDSARLMKIIRDSGYKGWIGIEYEGTRLTEFEGIQAAKRVLERFL
ncbi:MAG: sugar phosphate isomerase/epimerase family protein [Bryobacteraceae bacterium]